MLQDLQTYLKEKKRVPFPELLHTFKTDPNCLRDMLEILIQKGKLKCCKGTLPCKGCNACGALAFEFYEWQL